MKKIMMIMIIKSLPGFMIMIKWIKKHIQIIDFSYSTTIL